MCDLLCALPPATGGATLFAKNSDRPPGEGQLLEWHGGRPLDATQRATYVDVPTRRRSTISCLGSRPSWGWGFEHGVNIAGVAVGNASIFTTLDPRPFPDALTGMDIVRCAVEWSSDAIEAVEVIEELVATVGQGGSGHEGDRRPYWSSFLVADPRRAFVVETSGRSLAVEPVERTAALSNRTTIADFDAEHRHPRQPVERLVDPRLAASRQVLAEEPVTVARLQAHLRSHDSGAEGWSVCMHVDEPGHEQATTASMVAELPLGGRPTLHCLVGSPCQQRFVTYALGADPLVEAG
ncbi:MAG: hypothetical protein ACSLFP_05345 [Acidimicrobiales bacterium]